MCGHMGAAAARNNCWLLVAIVLLPEAGQVVGIVGSSGSGSPAIIYCCSLLFTELTAQFFFRS